MKTIDIKTIDLYAKEWFDKVNGNSYFSCEIYINGELIHTLPFQYGYGNHYEDMANRWLRENVFSKQLTRKLDGNTSLWSTCKKIGCKYSAAKRENCLKRDLYQ